MANCLFFNSTQAAISVFVATLYSILILEEPAAFISPPHLSPFGCSVLSSTPATPCCQFQVNTDPREEDDESQLEVAGISSGVQRAKRAEIGGVDA